MWTIWDKKKNNPEIQTLFQSEYFSIPVPHSLVVGEGEKELPQSPLSLPFPHLPPFKMLLATKNIQNVMEDPGGMVFKIKYDLLLFRNK